MQKAPPTGEPAADPSSTHDDDNDDSSSSDWDDPEERADWSGQHQRRSHPPLHKRVCTWTRDSFYFYVRQIDPDTPVSSAECSHSAFASAAS